MKLNSPLRFAFSWKKSDRKTQIANFNVDKFSNQQRWKEYPRENNKKVPKVQEMKKPKKHGIHVLPTPTPQKNPSAC